MDRPDLTDVDPKIRAYIEHLKSLVKDQPPTVKNRTHSNIILDAFVDQIEEQLPSELPTTLNIITISKSGMAKRTARHLYSRQHSGGMGIFDLDVASPDYPAILTCADETQNLIHFSNTVRAFRLNVSKINPTPVRSKGEILSQRISLEPDETIVAVVAITSVYPDIGVFLLGADGKGTVRLMPGFAPNKSMGGSGKLAMKCQKLVEATSIEQNDDLFIITCQGKIIRFKADEVPGTEGVIQGVNCISMRADEVAAAINTGLNQA